MYYWQMVKLKWLRFSAWCKLNISLYCSSFISPEVVFHTVTPVNQTAHGRWVEQQHTAVSDSTDFICLLLQAKQVELWLRSVHKFNINKLISAEALLWDTQGTNLDNWMNWSGTCTCSEVLFLGEHLCFYCSAEVLEFCTWVQHESGLSPVMWHTVPVTHVGVTTTGLNCALSPVILYLLKAPCLICHYLLVTCFNYSDCVWPLACDSLLTSSKSSTHHCFPLPLRWHLADLSSFSPCRMTL